MQKLMLIFLSLLVGSIALTSCKQQERKTKMDIISGLASPIQMQPEETILYLDDYIDGQILIDSLVGDISLHIQFEAGNRTVTMKENGQLPHVSSLKISTTEGDVFIPVYKSKKQKINFIYDPGTSSVTSVGIAGEMNAWNPENTPMVQQDGKWTVSLYLIPGNYGYQMVLDGSRALDSNNPETKPNGMGGFNSLLKVEGVPEDKVPNINLLTHNNKNLTFTANRAAEVVAYWNNQKIESDFHHDHYDLNIPKEAKAVKRSFIRLWATNESASSNYTLIPLSYGNVISSTQQLTREDKQSNIMYFVMVDRFKNGNSQNDKKILDDSIHPKANYLGGDLEGVLQKVESGYFDKLGVNNIWLSPIVRNPEGAYGYYNKDGIKSKFSAYHGYWPTSFTKVNSHFGNETDLKNLIASAHKKEYNMVLDFVANHVHESHPVYQANKDNEWATSLYLPDGTLNTEKWDEHRLTTWFDVFLPTLNLEKPEITEMLSDSAVFWLENYQFDGFRHDATKHIPEIFWRTLTKKVKAYQKESGHQVLQLGETYGTPELITSYISSGMLDGQFDFNVFDAVSTSICSEDIGFQLAADRIMQSQDYYGTNHIMGNISGNQDRSRFMALATGEVRFDEDSKYAGWSRDINKKTDTGYKKLAMLHAINMTIPGIPVIYYGDEIGLTGGNDPDNRRMMYFENWNEKENALFESTAKCAKLRRDNMSLLYGDLKFITIEDELLVYSRKYFDENCLVIVNNTAEQKELSIDLPVGFQKENLSSHFGQDFIINESNQLNIKINPFSFEIIVN
jgi:cyclomaltodextrinase